MASKVLKWRKESGDEGVCYGLILGATYHPPLAAKLWTTLDQKNMSLVKALERLVDDFHKDSKSYIDAARLVGALPASKVVSLFLVFVISSASLSGTPSNRKCQKLRRSWWTSKMHMTCSRLVISRTWKVPLIKRTSSLSAVI
jgi:hypothetical protein